MTTVLRIALVLCTLTTLRAEIELRGVVRNGGAYFLALSDSEDHAAPRLVAIGTTFRGYTVQSYEPARELARLTSKDSTIEVKLVLSRAKPAGEVVVDARALSDEDLVALGLYRIHAGDTGMKIAMLTKLSVRELLALNPGVRFDKLNVGQILAIANEPNKAPEPTR